MKTTIYRTKGFRILQGRVDSALVLKETVTAEVADGEILKDDIPRPKADAVLDNAVSQFGMDEVDQWLNLFDKPITICGYSQYQDILIITVSYDQV